MFSHRMRRAFVLAPSIFYSSFLAFFLFTASECQSQAVAPPVAPPPAPALVAPAAVPVAEIDTVSLFPQAASGAAQIGSANNFMLQINGKNLPIDTKAILLIPVPTTGVTGLKILSTDGSTLLASFTAPAAYSLEQVALSLNGTTALSFKTGTVSCDFAKNVVVGPQVLSKNQTETKYGNGIGKNFYAIQLSIVNKCSIPMDIPLAGLRISVVGNPVENMKHGKSISSSDQRKKSNTKCNSLQTADLTPFSLDHLTSIYSEDRQLTGARAVYFNSLQAAATIGSSIEPFFGPGFTSAVAILGGGFTTASKQIFVDMSAQQLQNITSQSFAPIEQIASGGSDQKFVFIRNTPGCGWNTQETNLRKGDFTVKYELIPASAAPPVQQTATASPAK